MSGFLVALRERWKKLCARVALDAPLGGPSTSPLDRMNPRHRFIECYCLDGRVGVLVELGHEKLATAAQKPFLSVAYRVAKIIAERNPQSTEALLRQPFRDDPKVTVEMALAAVPTLIGERVTITRFIRWHSEPAPELDPAVAMRLRRA